MKQNQDKVQSTLSTLQKKLKDKQSQLDTVTSNLVKAERFRTTYKRLLDSYDAEGEKIGGNADGEKLVKEAGKGVVTTRCSLHP